MNPQNNPRSSKEKMYAEILAHSMPYVRDLQQEFPYPGFLRLMDRVAELDFQLRCDLSWVNQVELNAIFANRPEDVVTGATILLKDTPPLIFMYLLREDTHQNRLDTVLHECVHATGFLVNRFEEQPRKSQTLAYLKEEFVAIYGAISLADRLSLNLGPRRHAATKELQATVDAIGWQTPEIETHIEEAERAAEFLASPTRPILPGRLPRTFQKDDGKPTSTTSASAMPKVPLRPATRVPGRIKFILPGPAAVRLEGRIVPMKPRGK